MRLLAGLAAGLTVYLVIGLIYGITPTWLHRRRPARVSGTSWAVWLRQADVGVRPGQFVAVSVAFGVVTGVLAGAVLRVPVLGVAFGLVAAALPALSAARRRRAAVRQRLAAWPDALRDVVGHLRSSMSVHAALCELGRTGPLPLRDRFVRYAGLAAALDQRTALEVVREELADPLSDRVIEVLLVAFDQGTSVVVDILLDLATSAADDLRLLDEIETLQLETKLEARGAAILPFVVLALLCTFTPGYREFYTTPAGWAVVVFGGLMSLGGLVVIGRLGRVRDEERILAVGS